MSTVRMILYTVIFIALRTFLQFVCDDYAVNNGSCKTLLKKAVAETLPDIRSAYFLKVMEADNELVKSTFAKYHIGFLASNTTYASEAEIMEQACKMPYATTEFLDWTAGVTPLVCVWFVFLIWRNIRHLKCCCKPKPIVVVEVKEQEIEMTAPPKDTPPRSPLQVPLYQNTQHRDYRQEPLNKSERVGIRRRQPRKKKDTPSVLEKITSLSPSLKSRIMNDDPMV